MTVKGEQWLLVKQNYLEGMLPYEYASILKALKYLGVPEITALFEASAVHEEALNSQVHHISPSSYYNKRFYKLTEEGVYEKEPEIQGCF